MRFHSSSIFLLFVFLMTDSVGETHTSKEGTNETKSSYVSQKQKKEKALRLDIDRLEIKKAEYGIEMAKLAKLNEGMRTKEQINESIRKVETILTEKKRQLELVNKLGYDDCYGEWDISIFRDRVNDSDSGFFSHYEENSYLVCSVVVDICQPGNTPYGIANNGRNGNRIYLRTKTDPRAGKKCKCMCMSDSFAKQYFRR